MWFFKKKKSLPQEVIDDIKKEGIDMQALFSNIGNRAKCEQLYKELAKKSIRISSLKMKKKHYKHMNFSRICKHIEMNMNTCLS